MTTRSDTTTRHHTTLLHKDTHMHHIELRLADIGERQALLRSIREGDRAAERRSRSIRRRIGESFIRLGRRVAGDIATSPAWQG